MKIFSGTVQPLNKRVAIVVSEFNRDITSALLEGAVQTLHTYLPSDNVTVIWVPGAVEIPLMVQRIAKQYDAVIALGAVIYGETDHYHYVCQQVNQGCQRVMLDESLPVIFGVLTVQSRELALSRVGGKKGHVGIESAEAVIKMLDLLMMIDAESV